MNDIYTNCNKCRHYDSKENTYPCNMCEHNHSKIFSLNTEERIKNLEQIVTMHGARIQVLLQHIQTYCPIDKRGKLSVEGFDKDGVPL